MRKTMTIIVTTTLLAVAVLATQVGATASGDRRIRTIEVSETGSRFVPDPDLVDANGVPTRGNYFVTEGYIYKPGTLTCSAGTCNGVVYDRQGNPSPEFPDKAIGSWTCFGTHTENASTTTTGPLVASTQLYDFGDSVGEHTIITSGFELADIGVSVSRAIIGGTGASRTAAGTQTQTLLGLNNPDLVVAGRPLFGVTLSVRLAVL